MKQAIIRDGKKPPKGITVGSPQRDEYVIHHTPTGMWGTKLFLLLWFSIWTFACLTVLRGYLQGATMEDGGPMSIWFVAVFWTGEIIVGVILARLFFHKSVFYLSRRNLVVETATLGLFKKSRRMNRHAIRKFIQTSSENGGPPTEGRTIPSWGLLVEQTGGKKEKLLSFQPEEKSWWLGQFFAQWAEVEFVTSSEIQEENEHSPSTTPSKPVPIPKGMTVRSSARTSCCVEYNPAAVFGETERRILFCIALLAICIISYLLFYPMMKIAFARGSALSQLVICALTVSFLSIPVLIVRGIKTSFRLNPHALIIEKDFLGMKRRTVIERWRINRFVQFRKVSKDSEGTTISWGLKIKGKKDITLLLPQSNYALSYWLGQYLAERAGVSFMAAKQ